jgi:predicted GH43/DUF377 family glycosyl hydrolase
LRDVRCQAGAATFVSMLLLAWFGGAFKPATADQLEKQSAVLAAETGHTRSTSSSRIGEWFDRYAGNPLDIPQYASTGVVHPDVLYFPDGEDGYKYWMYYTPYPPDSLEVPYLVRSNDRIHFDAEGVTNPMLTKSQPWEQQHLADEDVLKVGDTWFLYYVGVDSVGRASIGVATSPDGKFWSKYDHNPVITPAMEWERGWVGAPSICYDRGHFWMWFAGGYVQGIALASSVDGLHWTRENQGLPVLKGTPGQWDVDGISHPSVIKYRGGFWMYYWGFAGDMYYRLGLAKSVNGLDWEKSKYNPVLDTIQNSWEGDYIYRSSPIIVNDTMLLYYSAYDDLGTQLPKIGLATSFSYDIGDADQSGVVDVADIVFLISYLYRGGPAPNWKFISDTDCNGVIGISDVLDIVGYLFRNGPDPGVFCR